MFAGPEWSDDVVARNWPALQKALPEELLPHEIATGRFECFGCGSWGCVYPTSHSGVVFKMTTDATEMDFLATAAGLPDADGLTNYYALMKLDGVAHSAGSDLRPQPRQAYALLREAADEIGRFKIQGELRKLVPESVLKDRDKAGGAMRTFRQVADGLRAFSKFWAAEMESIWEEATSYFLNHGLPESVLYRADSLKTPRQLELEDLHPDDLLMEQVPEDPPVMLLQLMDALRQTTEIMMQSRSLPLVGKALHDFMREGLILADVHFKNIGVVKRGGRKAWVITDPGHLVRIGKTPAPGAIPHVRELRWRTSP